MKRATLHIIVNSICCAKIKGHAVDDEVVDNESVPSEVEVSEGGSSG